MDSAKRTGVIIAFIPYLAMIVGVPFVNSTRILWFLPELGMWILAWVVLTPAFLYAAYRIGWAGGDRR